jgi:chaperone modulatory protein CbpM
MIGLDELTRRFATLDRIELTRWVENRWVLPDAKGGQWLFHEVDIARVALILEMRREFAVDDEAMALVLGLLDQLYGVRRQMRRLCAAIECQPPEIRDAIRRALPKAGEES